MRMLELHMRVLAPQVEKFLVAESTLTFQFGEKPAHLTEALRRGAIAPELAQKLRVDVVSPDELLRRLATRTQRQETCPMARGSWGDACVDCTLDGGGSCVLRCGNCDGKPATCDLAKCASLSVGKAGGFVCDDTGEPCAAL